MEITDQEVIEFINSVETKLGGFDLVGAREVVDQLILRKREREEGNLQEIFCRRWPTMTEHFGGLANEELVVLTGESGRGKTTFFLLYMLDLLRQGFPGFIAFQEGGFGQFSKRVGEMVLQKNEKEFEDSDLGALSEILFKIASFYSYQPGGEVDQERLIAAMKYSVLKYGVKFCVIDHLGFVKLDRRNGKNTAEAIGDFLKKIKTFNAKMKVPVLLIAHPAKSGDKGYSDGREIGMDELKGSSDIKQLADTVMSLFRTKDKTALRFQKIRNSDYAKNTGLGIIFDYDHKRSELIEACVKPQKLKEN